MSVPIVVHTGAGPVTRAVEVACVLGAYGLMAAHAWRLAASAPLPPWAVALLVLAAWPAADFLSGLVHWSLDTWGRVDWPWVGPRLLGPFRVHHVNPQSFLQCDFFNTNGDVAGLVVVILSATFLLPASDPRTATAAVFVVALTFWGLPTNQYHQWAHTPRPPRWVAWLQDRWLILPRAHHGRHHTEPFLHNYCITNGWCNAPLEAVGFFRGLEWGVARLTGLVPRSDDEAYCARVRPAEAAHER